MRPATPPAARLVATLATVLVTLALAVAPVAAKEFEEARLDAPIPMGLPGGTEILVGITVTAMSPDGPLPIVGTPMYLRLTGRDGATTRAAGAGDHAAGHYTFRIAIPAGGARGIEIGIHGTSDLPIMLAGADPFTFGGITPRTAQLAPALAPAMTPLPRAAVPVARVEAPAATSAREPGPLGLSAPVTLLALVGGVVALLVVGLAMRARRPRVARDGA